MSDYAVVLLVEQGLSALDAAQVHGLHEEIEDPVVYTVLLPVEDAAGLVEGAVGSLGSGDLMPMEVTMEADQVRELQTELHGEARAALETSIQALEAAGATATGELLTADPVDGLATRAGQLGAAEVIILTRPHVVSEFFHLDWTSRARRKLGVPVLHLLERETFDEQAGQGEGITGL